jgi:hypothetical protein
MMEEAEPEDESESDELSNKLISSFAFVEFQMSLLSAMKIIHRIMSPRIDADRIGELVKEAGLDPDIFDKEFGDI